MAWRIAPDFLVRMTGFPIELMESLRLPRSAEAVDQFLNAGERSDELRERLLHDVFPPVIAAARERNDSDLRALYRARRAVGQHRTIHMLAEIAYRETLTSALEAWNAALDDQRRREKMMKEVWEQELTDARYAVDGLAREPRLREALGISNPAFLDAIDRYLCGGAKTVRSNRERRFERRFALYMQRLATKNETTSFFGPLNYGVVQPAHQSIELGWAETQERLRRSFPTQWMAQALANRIEEEPELSDYVPVRRGTLWRAASNSNVLRHALTDAVLPATDTAATIIAAADGDGAIALAERCGISRKQVNTEMIALLDAKVLVRGLIVPPVEDPLRWLIDWLAGTPSPAAAGWRPQLEALHCLLSSLSTLPLAERLAQRSEIRKVFTSLARVPPERGHGEAYADRDLVFEECLGGLTHFSVSTAFARKLEHALAPLLGLLHGLAEERRSAARLRARDVFASAASGKPRISFLRFAMAFRRSEIAPSSGDLEQALAELIRRRTAGRLCSLTAQDVEALSPGGRDAVSCSVDLMIAASSLDDIGSGSEKIVLGEVHPPALLHTFPAACFAPEARQRLRSLINGQDRVAEILVPRQTKLFSYPLGGREIELRPIRADSKAIPVSTVDVARTASGITLEVDGLPTELRPPVELAGATDPLLPFSLPALTTLDIDLGGYSPRIEIDGVVIQRERWRLVSQPFVSMKADDFTRFVEARRWARENGLPERSFVRAPHEPKPIAIDLASQFSIEVLDQLLRQTDTLLVSEMLPDVGELWLTAPDGRHTCELRMFLLNEGPDLADDAR